MLTILHSVSLTEVGQRLLEQLQPALQQIEQALDHLNDYRATPRGTLRLNVPSNVILAPHLGRFLKQYPDIQLEIVCEDKLIDIVAAGFDAGIRFEETLQQDMIALPLVQNFPIAIVASPEYLQQHGIPKMPLDLLQHQCLRWRFSDGEYYHWELVEQGKPLALAVQGPFASNDAVMLAEAARQGLGVAYLFKTHIE